LSINIHQIVADVQGVVSHGIADLHTVLDQHLPQLEGAASLVEKIANEPLFQAAEKALGLPDTTRAMLASVINNACDEFVALAQKLDAATADAAAAHAALNPPAPPAA
jgi:hypothetical protein